MKFTVKRVSALLLAVALLVLLVPGIALAEGIDGGKNPLTGDTSAEIWPFIVIVGAAVGIVAIILNKKSKKKRPEHMDEAPKDKNKEDSDKAE